ncbi:hypothetical protein A3D78_00220 [Candidatus Gottesmanbacteria bacterium RIFCSPHIGHO2_02_FULL_39_14]|uniref:Aminotransferase n=1 Tax=Candidatus Gottesmanbacteria bacterium RIFCSPHIGHO2_02_FULL_39_14 TaxID=1798383 RepID=A0A1F5ZWT1_9BACT|nr:MAG: hypothetical protein A3D78_00220 [Candidatus Gottesmanbacteria bacterium RIFCSPHIGHO2_02_FULL_39_14]
MPDKIQNSLSARMSVLKAEGAYNVLTKATQLEAEGKHIIHWEIGQPDFPTPVNISQEAIRAIKKGLTKYTPPLGIMPLRKRIAQEIIHSRGLDISEKQIAVTPSGKTALFVAMAALLEKGDEVIYPNPGFPSYETLARFFGCKLRPVPLLEKNNFSFDMKIFTTLFSKRTKVIILNSPGNPTGGVMSQDDLAVIAEAVKNSNCWVITDEMYSRIIYDNLNYPSFYSYKHLNNRIILVDGFSKTFSMTGWRIGYLSVPKEIIDKIDYLLTHLVGCTATFIQYAALAGLEGKKTELNKMIAEFQKRRNFIVKRLNQIDGIICQKPQGAFYVFPNIKYFGKSSKFLADYLLRTAGVALLDGTSFGKFGEGYLRISYATNMDNLNEGLIRIRKALANI